MNTELCDASEVVDLVEVTESKKDSIEITLKAS